MLSRWFFASAQEEKTIRENRWLFRAWWASWWMVIFHQPC